MKRCLVLIACCWCSVAHTLPAETWQEALRAMPLSAEIPLGRQNFLPVVLRAFQSNVVVKALIFLPGVSDDFYLINRDRPPLNLKAGNLLAAISALTNATTMRLTFQSPFLLLHLDRDELSPSLLTAHATTSRKLKQARALAHALWIDAHWERVQPALRGAFKVEILPEAQSVSAWHFARHNVAAWGLTDWEVLEALSISGKTRVAVQNNRILFQLRETP